MACMQKCCTWSRLVQWNWFCSGFESSQHGILAPACAVTFNKGSSAVTPTPAWPPELTPPITVQVCLPHAGLWRCTEPDGFHPHLCAGTAGTVLHWGEHLNELLSTPGMQA